MSSQGSSQSQSSYLKSMKYKPPIEVFLNQIQLCADQQSASNHMTQIADVLHHNDDEYFYVGLKGLNILFQKGYSSLFMTHTLLMRKMMNHFTQLGKQLQQEDSPVISVNVEGKMLYVLSIIAQIIRQNSKFYFPFTRKFLRTVFRIDAEMLEKSQRKNDILAILSVIYQNLTRQGTLLTKYKVGETLKLSILQKYFLVQQLFTLKMFNKSIVNLAERGQKLSIANFQKYKLIDTLSQFISKNQIELLLVKMKMAMIMINNSNANGEQTGELVENGMKNGQNIYRGKPGFSLV